MVSNDLQSDSKEAIVFDLKGNTPQFLFFCALACFLQPAANLH